MKAVHRVDLVRMEITSMLSGFANSSPRAPTTLLALLCMLGCSPDQPVSVTSTTVHGQETPPAGLVIRNARVIVGTGTVIENGAIVIRNGRIDSVGPQADLMIPAGAMVVDAGGRSALPGFMDSHRHLADGDAAEWFANEAVGDMQAFLDAGFTTVLSAIDPDQVVELKRQIESGQVRGPRLIVAGIVPLSQGAMRGELDPARTDVSRPPDRPTSPARGIPDQAVREMVGRVKESGRDAVKTVIIVTPQGPETETLRVVVDEARKLGLPVITHAVTVMDTLAAVEAGTTTLVHTPHIGALTNAEAQTIAVAGIPMSSTLGIFVPAFAEDNLRVRNHADDDLPRFRDLEPFPMNTLSSAGQGPVNARMLYDAGVVYAYGTDTRYTPVDALRQELRPLRLVFSAKDIIKIMTVNTAAILGRSADLGTLEAGKIADVVLVAGNPLNNIHDLLDVDFVVKDGQVMVDKR